MNDWIGLEGWLESWDEVNSEKKQEEIVPALAKESFCVAPYFY